MQFIEEFMGYKIYFVHISYECPTLVLYGFSTERQLKSAIKRVLKKRGVNHASDSN